MPRLSRLSLDDRSTAVFVRDANAPAGHAQHQHVEIPTQQQVAAAADDQQFNLVRRRVRQRLADITVVMGLGKQSSPYIDTKGVEGLE